ncbi:hypothetical protein ACFYTQ_18415 [Nocardia sp. NPDC004068]|uniref:hypothetical protein n=1 Tax=Nocardia sp. NPDC004068 TaxID=3364303 RepID=UPI00368E2CD3
MTKPNQGDEYSDEVPIKPDRDKTPPTPDDKTPAQTPTPEPATDTTEGSGEPPD